MNERKIPKRRDVTVRFRRRKIEPQTGGELQAGTEQQSGVFRHLFSSDLWGRSSKIVLLLKGAFILFVAPLFATDLDFGPIWLPFAIIGLWLIIYFLAAYQKSRGRAFKFHLNLLAVIFCIGVLYFAAKPFLPLAKLTYVVESWDNTSKFDIKQYLSYTFDPADGSRVLVANHPVHGWIARAISLVEPTRIKFVSTTTQSNEKVLELPIKPSIKQRFHDLSGAPYDDYNFDVTSPNHKIFSLSAVPYLDQETKNWSIGLDMKIKTRSDPTQLGFRLLYRQDAFQWDAITIGAGLQRKVLEYAIKLLQVLNADDFHHEWQRYRSQLWALAPSDRERLRLVVFDLAELKPMAKGNIMSAELLPGLSRGDGILVRLLRSESDAINDQLVYQAAEFLSDTSKPLAQLLPNRFQSLRNLWLKAKSANQPHVLTERTSGSGIRKMRRLFTTPIIMANPDLSKYVKEFIELWEAQLRESEKNADDDNDGDSLPEVTLSPYKAWLADASWGEMVKSVPQIGSATRSLLIRAGDGPADVPTSPQQGFDIWHKDEISPQDFWSIIYQCWWLELLHRGLLSAEKGLEHKQRMRVADKVDFSLAYFESIISQTALCNDLLLVRQELFHDAREFCATDMLFAFVLEATRAGVTPETTPIDKAKENDFSVRAGEYLASLASFPSSPLGSLLFDNKEDFESSILAIKQVLDASYSAKRIPILLGHVASAWSHISPELTSSYSRLYDNFQSAQTMFKPGDAKTNPTFVTDFFTRLNAQGAFPHSTWIPRLLSQKNLKLADDLCGIYRNSEDSAERDMEAYRKGTKLMISLGDDFPMLTPISFFHRMAVKGWQDKGRSTAADAPSVDPDLETPLSSDHSSAELSERFVRQVIALTQLRKKEGQRTRLYSDPVRGRDAIEPAFIDTWVSEVSTLNARSDGLDGYRATGECLFLDLLLRTFDDEIDGGYQRTRFAQPGRIFESLAGCSVDQYLQSIIALESEKASLHSSN